MTNHTAITSREVKLEELAGKHDEIRDVQKRCQEQLDWTIAALDTNDKAQYRTRVEIELLKTGIDIRELEDATNTAIALAEAQESPQ